MMRIVLPLLGLCCALPGVQAHAQSCEGSFALEEVVRFGTATGDVTLTGVTDLEVGPDGNAYVGQAGENFIAVFGPNGESKGLVGRAGSGPGEFSAPPRYLEWVGENLYATERFATITFDTARTEVGRASFRVVYRSEGSSFVAGFPLADGTFLGSRYWTPPLSAFFGARDLPLRRFSRSGEVIDTIATVNHSVPAVGGVAFRREFENRRLSHPLSWSTRGLSLPVVVTKDEKAIVFVRSSDDGSSTSFDLLKIGIAGDTLMEREIPYEPIPLSTADRRRTVDAYAEWFAGSVRPRRERTRIADKARRALDLPRSYPPVRSIVAGGDDTIWLLTESAPSPADVWQIYDSAGEAIGQLRIEEGRTGGLPWDPRLRILHATRDEVWGLTIDELDVPYIHRFDVVPWCG